MSAGGSGAGALRSADPVLFDLDGTITASGPGILASIRHALAELGEPIPDDEVLAAFIGPPLADSFQTICGMGPQRAWQAVTAYRAHYTRRGQYQSAVYDGIPELLASLRAAGRVLAVATSKAEVYARSILEHYGLTGHFTEVVGSELDGRRTAKSEVLAEALRRLGAAAAGAVMIGDRSHDVLGAAAVGMPCIGAAWGYGTQDELREAGALLVAARPDDLIDVLLA